MSDYWLRLAARAAIDAWGWLLKAAKGKASGNYLLQMLGTTMMLEQIWFANYCRRMADA